MYTLQQSHSCTPPFLPICFRQNHRRKGRATLYEITTPLIAESQHPRETVCTRYFRDRVRKMALKASRYFSTFDDPDLESRRALCEGLTSTSDGFAHHIFIFSGEAHNHMNHTGKRGKYGWVAAANGSRSSESSVLVQDWQSFKNLPL